MSAINHKLKTVFIHVPKVAGSSMERRNFIQKHSHNQHADIEFFYNLKFVIPTLELDEYFKFAFVRNPYTRLASAILGNVIGEKRVTKPLFNQTILEERETLNNWVVTKPMHTFLCMEGEMKMDFVGKFEDLQKDWNKVCDMLGVANYLPHANKGRHIAPYDGLYSLESKEIVRKVYAKDFEMFDYAK